MSNTLKGLRQERLKKIVDLNDMLSKQLEDNDQIKFPKIVICGDQSHGKTSLLENIIEFSFPRGSGTQTRVPFRIQIREGPELSLVLKYKDQSNNTIEKKVEQDNLEQELREAQRIVTGDETSIKNEVIDLEIKQPDLDTLTIIDLPGFIHFQENVNDSDSTQKVIKEIYDYYLKDSDTTICVVVSAAVDLNTSSTFSLARQHDFGGGRTILCVTKVDQRQDTPFTDFVLKAKKNKISQVFFVRNRTQSEVDRNMSYSEARQIEKDFLTNNRFLSQYPNDKKGLPNLCKHLIHLQEESILPNLLKNKSKLESLLNRKKKELEELGVEFTEKSSIQKFIQKKFDSVYTFIKNQYYEIDDIIENVEFYEKMHTKNDNRQTFCIWFDISDIQIEYNMYQENDNMVTVEFKSNKECGLKIDTQITTKDGMIIYRNFEVILKKEEQQNIKMDQGEKYLIKFVNRPPNVFKKFYKLREEYEKLIKNRYLLHYFLSEQFEQYFKLEKERVQQQFGLVDRDFANLAERILKNAILPSVRQSSKDFVEESSKNLQSIWTQKNQNVFAQFPLVQHLIEKIIQQEFKPQNDNLNKNLEIDFITASQLTTCSEMYLIMIQTAKDYLLQGIGEDNVLLKSYLEKVPKEEIRQIYQDEDKRPLYDQGLRIWSYWNIVSIRLLDAIVNKVPLFLIQYPIQNIRDEVFKTIINLSESDLRKLVNSEKKVQERKEKKGEIKILQDSLDMVNKDFEQSAIFNIKNEFTTSTNDNSENEIQEKNENSQDELPEDNIG